MPNKFVFYCVVCACILENEDNDICYKCEGVEAAEDIKFRKTQANEVIKDEESE